MKTGRHRNCMSKCVSFSFNQRFVGLVFFHRRFHAVKGKVCALVKLCLLCFHLWVFRGASILLEELILSQDLMLNSSCHGWFGC